MNTIDTISKRLRASGLELPSAMPAVANYVPAVVSELAGGALIHVAGQGPFRSGRLDFVGRIGAEIGMDQARASAELVTLNLMAQAATAANDRKSTGAAGRLRCLRLGVFLNCVDGFTAMDEIADTASAVVLIALAGYGRHSRTVVGKPALPMQTSVEIDGIFLLEP